MKSLNGKRQRHACVCVGGGNWWIALFRFWALWKIRRFILRNSARQFQLLFAQHAGWGGRQLAPSIKFSITFMISCALFHFPIFLHFPSPRYVHTYNDTVCFPFRIVLVFIFMPLLLHYFQRGGFVVLCMCLFWNETFLEKW